MRKRTADGSQLTSVRREVNPIRDSRKASGTRSNLCREQPLLTEPYFKTAKDGQCFQSSLVAQLPNQASLDDPKFVGAT